MVFDICCDCSCECLVLTYIHIYKLQWRFTLFQGHITKVTIIYHKHVSKTKIVVENGFTFLIKLIGSSECKQFHLRDREDSVIFKSCSSRIQHKDISLLHQIVLRF